MSQLIKIFSGKLNEDCYLFTLKVILEDTAQCIDIGNIIINAKTDSVMSIIDKLPASEIKKEVLDSVTKDCKRIVKRMQRIL